MDTVNKTRRDDLRKLTELKKGEKYTLVRPGGMGFVFSSRFVLQDVRVQPYAQYPESFLLVVKEERKRNLTGYRFYSSSDEFAIWEGYEKPNTEMYVEEETLADGTVIARRSLASFDPQYMINAVNSVSKDPILARLPEVEENVSDKD